METESKNQVIASEIRQKINELNSLFVKVSEHSITVKVQTNSSLYSSDTLKLTVEIYKKKLL